MGLHGLLLERTLSPSEWQEIIVETEARWPGHWTPQMAVSFFSDLREFSAVDVWSAWNALNDSGREFPPNGSLLRSGAIDQRRDAAKRELWDRPQLVNPDGTVTWQTYALRTFGKPVGLSEAVQIEHRRWEGCRSPLCDIHTS